MKKKDIPILVPDLSGQSLIARYLDEIAKLCGEDYDEASYFFSACLIVTAIREGFGEIIESLESAMNPSSVMPAAIGLEDAARYLGIRIETLEYLVRTRRLRYVQVGEQRGRVFRVRDLDEFLDENSQLTATEMLRKKGRK